MRLDLPARVAAALTLLLFVCAAPARAEVAGATTGDTQAAAGRLVSSVLGSCAVTPQSTVHCWGENHDGQLVTGDDIDVGATPGTSTVQVFLARGIVPVQLSSGYDTSCALDTAGSVWCWGRNLHGQVGDGSGGESLGDAPGERPYRVKLPGGQTAKQVATGREHTCAILADRSVACWGANQTGQLGIGSTDDEIHLPTPVSLGGQLAYGLATRDNHTCVVTMTRKLRCWGANTWGQTGSPNGVGASAVTAPTAPTVVDGSANFLGISVGRTFSCAVTAPAGDVLCWGEGTQGQLANGTGSSLTSPGSTAASINLGGAKAVAISTGSDTACALTDAGAVRCWGGNDAGMLGGGFVGNNWGDSGGAGGAERTPITVSLGAGRTATALAVGGSHTCALLSSGVPLCWGEGGAGQRANGSGTDSNTTTPASLPTVAFGADLPDGDGDGVPDRFDGCPAVGAATDDGCPPPPPPPPPAGGGGGTPLPQIIAKPPIAKLVPKRKLKVVVALKLAGKAKSCPKAGSATVVGAKPAFKRSVKTKKTKVKGKSRCAVNATLTWTTTTATGKKVKVKVAGKGLTSRTITVKVAA